MGKFSNQKKNRVKNKVAVTVKKAQRMKADAKNAKKDGEVDVEMKEEVVRVRGLAVSSLVRKKRKNSAKFLILIFFFRKNWPPVSCKTCQK